MKITLIITLMFFVLDSLSQSGQYILPPDPIDQLGTCENTRNFCFDQYENVPFDDGTCSGGVTTIIYSFIPNVNFSVPSPIPGGYTRRLSYCAYIGSQPISTSYIVYGPFNLSDDCCQMIDNSTAPILDQGTVNQTTLSDITASFLADKLYFFEVVINACEGVFKSEAPIGLGSDIRCGLGTPCESCIPKFQPSAGEYIISAWVREDGVPPESVNYTGPEIQINAGPDPLNLLGGPVTQSKHSTGKIIDGWQKIEEKFFVTDETSFELRLVSTNSHDVYFDDIRIYPNDGSAITYVYDPLTLRLMAELDERNYATFYEYDEEGKLVRIKKETEKGIMTIQENRDNNSLKP